MKLPYSTEADTDTIAHTKEIPVAGPHSSGERNEAPDLKHSSAGASSPHPHPPPAPRPPHTQAAQVRGVPPSGSAVVARVPLAPAAPGLRGYGRGRAGGRAGAGGVRRPLIWRTSFATSCVLLGEGEGE